MQTRVYQFEAAQRRDETESTWIGGRLVKLGSFRRVIRALRKRSSRNGIAGDAYYSRHPNDPNGGRS